MLQQANFELFTVHVIVVRFYDGEEDVHEEIRDIPWGKPRLHERQNLGIDSIRFGYSIVSLMLLSAFHHRIVWSDDGPGHIFYQKARLLLSEVVAQCSLESIQACFLMGLYLLPSNISDLSYVYHGMALKMAISAGLHRKVAQGDLETTVLHVRNRLWWSLYTSERYTSRCPCCVSR